jgi:hypothetical protein
MKKNIQILLFAVSSIALLSSYLLVKPSQLIKTKLNITVRNELGNLVEGAKIQLFATKEDYDKTVNELASKLTDKKGVAVFTDLGEHVYFVNVEKGEANNFNAATRTDTLSAHKINKVTIIISE